MAVRKQKWENGKHARLYIQKRKDGEKLRRVLWKKNNVPF